jgi:hypothetical protein
MTIRTTKKTVSFTRPFVLGGFNEVLPAGVYNVETDEELLEGLSFPAYRRILTVIRLHAKPDRPGITRSLTINPNELDAALTRDQAPTEAPVGRDVGKKAPPRTTKARHEDADRRDLDRAEGEGMIVHAG